MNPPHFCESAHHIRPSLSLLCGSVFPPCVPVPTSVFIGEIGEGSAAFTYGLAASISLASRAVAPSRPSRSYQLGQPAALPVASKAQPCRPILRSLLF